MIEIELNCGIKVNVEGFEYGYTYGGLLEGKPNKRINKHILESITYPKNWGPRKVLNIQPSINEIENRLKPSYYSVWLTSEPIDPEYHGSELVVIWFGEIPNGKTIETIIEVGIKFIDWNANANDFRF